MDDESYNDEGEGKDFGEHENNNEIRRRVVDDIVGNKSNGVGENTNRRANAKP